MKPIQNSIKNNIISKPSPNFNARPENSIIDCIIIHYTGMKSAAAALDRMCEAASNVSAHYCVDEAGQIYNLVADEMRAWHAGKSFWDGGSAINIENLNNNSIGIEIVNKGHDYGYGKFSDVQMQAVLNLLKILFAAHPIKKELVLAHSDIAPDRKEDPGEFFDWQLLAKNNFSIWHNLQDEFFKTTPECPLKDIINFGDSGKKVEAMQKKLKQFGYKIEVTEVFDLQTKQAIAAFYRRFIPHRILDNKNTKHPENIFWDNAANTALERLLQPLK
jgi:N-acetylmuramoyl-L-alanine amidase